MSPKGIRVFLRPPKCISLKILPGPGRGWRGPRRG